MITNDARVIAGACRAHQRGKAAPNGAEAEMGVDAGFMGWRGWNYGQRDWLPVRRDPAEIACPSQAAGSRKIRWAAIAQSVSSGWRSAFHGVPPAQGENAGRIRRRGPSTSAG